MLDIKQIKDQGKLFKSVLSKFKNDGFSVRPMKDSKPIKKLEKRMGMKLPPEVIELYSSSKSFRIGWEGLFEDYKIRGHCTLRIFSILDSLDLGHDQFLDLSGIEDSTVNTEKLFILDSIDHLGNYVLIHLGEDTPQLFLFTHGSQFHRLNLSVTEYIEKLIMYLGMSYWQQFYLEKPGLISEFYLFDPRYLKALEALLPAEEYSFVSEKFQDLPAPQILELPEESIVETLTQRVKSLKENYKVRGGKVKPQKNVDASTLIKASETLGRALPPGFVQLYAQTNGLELEWSKGTAGGSIILPPLEEMFASEHHWRFRDWSDPEIFKDILWFGEEDDLEIFKQLKPLEQFNGSSDFVGFLVNENGDIELYYSYGRNDILKLPIGLDKYLELSFRLLGFYGWQTYYLRNLDTIDAGTEIVEEIQQFFPDFREEEFQA